MADRIVALEDLRELVRPVMDELLDAAVANAASEGGPFSALVLTTATGIVVARGVNRVTATYDPTAHAEVAAIRSAARADTRVALDGMFLLASCEPCPMCLAACLWSRLDAVVFAATRQDAAAVGFDDELFHSALGAPDVLPSVIAGMRVLHLEHPRQREPFEAWALNPDRIHY